MIYDLKRFVENIVRYKINNMLVTFAALVPK